MANQHLEAGFAHALEEIENLNHAVHVPDAFDEVEDQLEFIQDSLYALDDLVATFGSLQTIVENQEFKVRVGDLFVNDCTIDSSPVITLGTLGRAFKHDEARRIKAIVTRYMKQTATLQPFTRLD